MAFESTMKVSTSFYDADRGSSWSTTSVHQPIKLPKELRGYVRYIVVLHPEDSKPYSIGVKYVCHTEGAEGLMAYLIRNVNRKHKKHVHSWLCQSVTDGSCCALGADCPNIHVTPEGYHGRRNWLRPLKGSRSCDADEEEAELETCLSSHTESTITELEDVTSAATSMDSLSSLCSSPNVSRPISPVLSAGTNSPALSAVNSPAKGLPLACRIRIPDSLENLPRFSMLNAATNLQPTINRLRQRMFSGEECATPTQPQAHTPYSCGPSPQSVVCCPTPFGSATGANLGPDFYTRQERLEKTRFTLHNNVDRILRQRTAEGLLKTVPRTMRPGVPPFKVHWDQPYLGN